MIAMKIVEASSHYIRFPIGYWVGDAQSKANTVDLLFVRLVTDNGLEGWGFNWNYTQGMSAVKKMIDEVYFPAIMGEDPFMHKKVVEKLYYKTHFIGRVGVALVGICAIEMAMWDLKCKSFSAPLWKVLGAYRDKVELYNTDVGWLTYSKEELVEKAVEQVKKGFRVVKLKIGLPDPYEDLERIRAVREAVGEKVRIAVDVNTQWDINTAIIWGKKLEQFDVYWLEEPLHPFDVKGHAKLARMLNVPIALGETLYNKQMFRDFIEAGAVTFVQPEVTKLSGITEFMEVASMAAANGLLVIPHTNVHQKIHSQLAAALPNAPLMEHCYESVLKIWKYPPKIEGNYMYLPQEPGVGVEPKQEVLEKYKVEE